VKACAPGATFPRTQPTVDPTIEAGGRLELTYVTPAGSVSLIQTNFATPSPVLL